MKQIEFDSVEIVKGKVKRKKRVETYSDNQVRHCDWCTVCGMSGYPECMKECDSLKQYESCLSDEDSLVKKDIY